MQFREDVLPERGAPPDDDPNDAVTRLSVVVRPSLVDGMSDPIVSEALAKDIAGVSPLLTEDTLTSLVAALVEDENPAAFADPFEEARRKRVEHEIEPTKVSARFGEAPGVAPLFNLNLGSGEGTRTHSLEGVVAKTVAEPIVEREPECTRILAFPTPTNGVRTPFAMVAAAPSRVDDAPSTYPPMPHPLYTPAPPAWTSPTLPPPAPPSRSGAWLAAAAAAALIVVTAGFYGLRTHQKHAAAVSAPSAPVTALPPAASSEAPVAAPPSSSAAPLGPEPAPPRKKASRPRPVPARP